MRKVMFFVFVAFSLTQYACKTSGNAKNISQETERLFRGDWQLSKIQVDQSAYFKVEQIFNQTSQTCFEGSLWHFVKNNNSGYYSISKAGCPSVETNFKWFVQEATAEGAKYFFFKPLEAGVSARKIKTGYKLKVVSIDGLSAVLQQEVPVQGGGFTTIQYQFKKQSK